MEGKYVFENMLGIHVFDSEFKLVKTLKTATEAERLPNVPEDKLYKVVSVFKPRAKEFYVPGMAEIKKSIKESVGKDTLIIQTIKVIDDLEKVANSLVNRTRDWYELYNPEFSNSISNHQKFVELILARDKPALLRELNINKDESMGADLLVSDVDEIKKLAKKADELYALKDEYEKYIESLMKEVCPNMLVLTGPIIGAKLLEHAGSLKRLMVLPASTVQLLGAEKALFRHIRSGAKPPKYGLLFCHPMITLARRDEKGKVARALADKIALALKIDYFKGEFIGDKLKKELEDRFK